MIPKMKIKNPYIWGGTAEATPFGKYLLTDNYGMIYTQPGGVLAPVWFEYETVTQIAGYLDRLFGEHLEYMNVEGFFVKLHNIHSGERERWVFAEAFHAFDNYKERVSLELFERSVKWAIEQQLTWEKSRGISKDVLNMTDILLPSAHSTMTASLPFL